MLSFEGSSPTLRSKTNRKKGRKNKGKYRTIYKVRSPLNNLQKNIAYAISAQSDFPEYVQGFLKKRSIATNASFHLAKKYVLNIDIKDFFDSIKTHRVINVFRELGCTDDIANCFAELCTLNGSLVQGARTSPVLSNLVCKKLDQDFKEIAANVECTYSRYADDITFSGDRIPKKKTIINVLNEHEFTLQEEKWNSQPRGQTQYVTGLTVFDDLRPRVPKKIKRQLRQALHYASKYGLSDHFDSVSSDNPTSRDGWIDGMIAFIYSIEPECALKLDIKWQQILEHEGLAPTRKSPQDIFSRRAG